MKHMLNFLLSSLIIIQCARAQEIISNGGDHFDSGNGSLSWTIGEPVVETFGNGYILTQGFQQNYEAILSLQNLGDIAQFNIYPNPFETSIHISGMDHTFSGTEGKIRLFDNSGRMVYEGLLEPIIYLQDLSVGSYILHLEMHNGDLYVFRMSKSNTSQP